MCLILFSYNSHSKYKLVVAANRDELYARPTAQANFWPDHPHVLAGRDLQANGTWMGINKFGQLAMLTNYRDLTFIKPDAKSRGHLVADFLIGTKADTKDYLLRLSQNDDQFNGYNIILGTTKTLCYHSNVIGAPREIKNGIYGLSNHLLDTPWPKVEWGKEKLRAALRKEEPDIEELFSTLYSDIKAPDHLLPDTGIGLEMERLLSSVFIKSPDYGSRCSTVLLVDNNDRWRFYERTYNPKDFSYKTVQYQFLENN